MKIHFDVHGDYDFQWPEDERYRLLSPTGLLNSRFLQISKEAKPRTNEKRYSPGSIKE